MKQGGQWVVKGCNRMRWWVVKTTTGFVGKVEVVPLGMPDRAITHGTLAQESPHDAWKEAERLAGELAAWDAIAHTLG